MWLLIVSYFSEKAKAGDLSIAGPAPSGGMHMSHTTALSATAPQPHGAGDRGVRYRIVSPVGSHYTGMSKRFVPESEKSEGREQNQALADPPNLRRHPHVEERVMEVVDTIGFLPREGKLV